MTAPAYPDSAVITDYYYQEGPPVVTYYAPPVDYAYLYSWVPYPFWWWNFWFPGFFVLADFHGFVHGHGHGHGHDGHGEFVSNHFRDSRTGMISRVDPVHRAGGGRFSDRAVRGWSSASGSRGAQAIFNGSRTVSTGRGNAGATVLPSRSRTYVSPSGRSGMMSGNAARTYARAGYSGWGTFSQRSFSQPSGESRSFHSFGGGTGSFSGTSRGSFVTRSSSFAGGGRGSFGGGGRR